MKFVAALSLLASTYAFTPSKVDIRANTVALQETKADLKAIAAKANPLVNYFDPLNLGESELWGATNEGSIGFLRQSEIKHGRVAMAAFVGYCVQSNFHFPWAQTLAGDPHPSIELSPEAQWDAIPQAAKWQIFFVISMLELWDECGGGGIMPHYMNGRQPGKYPSFKVFTDNVHFVLELYDPFGFNKKMSAEVKEKRLITEINNGRLAMLGIMGFIAADKVPGSVPILDAIGATKPYDGNVMIPFEGQFSYYG